jgi:hypothetical protein
MIEAACGNGGNVNGIVARHLTIIERGGERKKRQNRGSNAMLSMNDPFTAISFLKNNQILYI